MTDQPRVDTSASDAEERCTLATQVPQPADAFPYETLPQGERERYVDYEHPHFPAHW